MTQVRTILDNGALPITLDELRDGSLDDTLPGGGRRRLVVAVAVAVALACAAAAVWATAWSADDHGSVVSPASLSKTFVNASRNVSARYPGGWQVAAGNLTPSLGLPGKPYEVAALGTFPMEPADHNCAQMPVNALEDMTATDAFVWIAERSDYASGTYPTRPTEIAPDDGALADPSSDFGVTPAGCLDHPAAASLRTFVFEDQGRSFFAIVAVGDAASPERTAQAYEVLNSLSVG